MPLIKIRERHQITIPKEIVDKLQVKTGDWMEIEVREGKAALIPRRVVPHPPAPKLSAREQRVLETAQKKITAIQEDLKNSKGLTREEAQVAARVGLIDPGQKWWWLESWQEGEREAQGDIEAGRVTAYDSPEAFVNSLATR